MTERIYRSEHIIVALSDVQHVLIAPPTDRAIGSKFAVRVVTCHTRWNPDVHAWANDIFLEDAEAEKFVAAWMDYRLGVMEKN